MQSTTMIFGTKNPEKFLCCYNKFVGNNTNYVSFVRNNSDQWRLHLLWIRDGIVLFLICCCEGLGQIFAVVVLLQWGCQVSSALNILFLANLAIKFKFIFSTIFIAGKIVKVDHKVNNLSFQIITSTECASVRFRTPLFRIQYLPKQWKVNIWGNSRWPLAR